jgi:ABC-type multidrug transport system fused ATPase/permease subunit
VLDRIAIDRLERYVSERISKAAFSHIIALSSDFHDSNTSDLERYIDKAPNISSLIRLIVRDSFPLVVDFLVTTAYLISISRYIAFAIALVFILTTLLRQKTSRKISTANRHSTEVYNERSRLVSDVLRNLRAVTIFNGRDFEQQRLSTAIEKEYDADRILEDTASTVFFAQTFIEHSCLLLAIVLMICTTEVAGSNLITLITGWLWLTTPLMVMAQNYRRTLRSLAQIEPIVQFMETGPIVPDTEEDLTVTAGRIELKRVNFSYGKGGKPTLRDFTLNLDPGKIIVFIGKTGSGKTTVFKLLHGFYKADDGEIKIDRQDINKTSLSSLQAAIGDAPQSPCFFNLTIIENVRYARREATNDEVYWACREAYIYEDIMTLPAGYKTKIGQGGVELSGGQYQRLSLARLFLRKAPIALLDEPTSSLDTKTAAQIWDSIKKFSQGRTTIIITHSQSIMEEADDIYEIEDGGITKSKGSKG